MAEANPDLAFRLEELLAKTTQDFAEKHNLSRNHILAAITTFLVDMCHVISNDSEDMQEIVNKHCVLVKSFSKAIISVLPKEASNDRI